MSIFRPGATCYSGLEPSPSADALAIARMTSGDRMNAVGLIHTLREIESANWVRGFFPPAKSSPDLDCMGAIGQSEVDGRIRDPWFGSPSEAFRGGRHGGRHPANQRLRVEPISIHADAPGTCERGTSWGGDFYHLLPKHFATQAAVDLKNRSLGVRNLSPAQRKPHRCATVSPWTTSGIYSIPVLVQPAGIWRWMMPSSRQSRNWGDRFFGSIRGSSLRPRSATFNAMLKSRR